MTVWLCQGDKNRGRNVVDGEVRSPNRYGQGAQEVASVWDYLDP